MSKENKINYVINNEDPFEEIIYTFNSPYEKLKNPNGIIKYPNEVESEAASEHEPTIYDEDEEEYIEISITQNFNRVRVIMFVVTLLVCSIILGLIAYHHR